MISSDRKPKSPWLRLADFIMFPVTLCALVAVLMVLAGGVINPNVWWVPAFVILGAPFIYLLYIIATAYWVLRWNLFVAIPMAVVMLFAVWNVGAFVQVRFWKAYQEKSGDQLRVMSYNVHCFNFENQSYETHLNDVVGFINSSKPDVICLQEFMPIANDTTARMANLFAQWPYFVAMMGGSSPGTGFGTVIFSRYPMTVTQRVLSDSATGGALGVELYVEGDTINLFNCHLQTTSFNAVNNEQGLRALFASDHSTALARTTTRLMRDSFMIRAVQADSVAAQIARCSYPLVVVGDLNSVPLSYTYHTVRASMKDAFVASGLGYGYTYRPMSKLLRIDYAFYDDNQYECLNYVSPDLPYSDHNPIVVTLKKKI